MEKYQNGRTELMILIIDMNFKRALDMINNSNVEYLNIQDKNGTTALHIACFFNKKTLIKLLLDKGADSYIKDNNNICPNLDKYLVYSNPRIEIEKKLKTKEQILEIQNYIKLLDSDEKINIFEKWYLDSLIFEYELWKQENNIYSSSESEYSSSDSDSNNSLDIFI